MSIALESAETAPCLLTTALWANYCPSFLGEDEKPHMWKLSCLGSNSSRQRSWNSDSALKKLAIKQVWKQKAQNKPGVMTQACNLNTREKEAGGSQQVKASLVRSRPSSDPDSNQNNPQDNNDKT